MKERMDKLTAFLAEESKMTKLDVVLSILVALFSGILLGMLLSPGKNKRKYGDECDDCALHTCGDCDCEGGLCCKDCCSEERCCGEHEYCGNDELCCEEDFSEADNDADDKSYVKIR